MNREQAKRKAAIPGGGTLSQSEFVAHIISPPHRSTCLTPLVRFEGWFMATREEAEEIRGDETTLQLLLQEHKTQETHLYGEMNFVGQDLRRSSYGGVELSEFTITEADSNNFEPLPSHLGFPWLVRAKIDFSRLQFDDDVIGRTFVLMLSLRLGARTSQSESVCFTIVREDQRNVIRGGFDFPDQRHVASNFLILEGWALRPGDALARAELFAGELSLGRAKVGLESKKEARALPFLSESENCRFSLAVSRRDIESNTYGEELLRSTFPLRVEAEFVSRETVVLAGPQFRWDAAPDCHPENIYGELEGLRVVDEGLVELSGWVITVEGKSPVLFLEGRTWRLELEDVSWSQREELRGKYPTLVRDTPIGFTVRFHPSILGPSPGLPRLSAETPAARLVLTSRAQEEEISSRIAELEYEKNNLFKSGLSRLLCALGVRSNFAKRLSPITVRPKFPERMLFASHNLSPTEGAPRVLLEIIKGLKKDGLSSLEMLVVSPKSGGMHRMLEDLGVRVEIIPELRAHEQDWTGYQNALREIEEKGRRFSPDFVFANVIDSFWAVDFASRNGLPAMWLLHESVSPLDWFQNLEPRLRLIYLARLETCKRVCFVSQQTRELFAPVVSDEQARVIPNGLDVDAYGEEKSQWPREKSRSKLCLKEEFVVSIIGTTTRRKGQDVFLRGIAELRKLAPELSLRAFVVGARTVPFLRELEELREALELHDVVEFVPETPHVAPYYCASDAVVIASREESAPLVSLEAFAFETPLVSTAVYGLAEQLEDRRNALLFDVESPEMLGKCLLELSENSSLRKDLVSAGTTTLKTRFGLKKALDEYRAVIEETFRV